MDTILFLSTVFCSFLPLTTIFALTPYISRKGTCFGVLLMEDAQRSHKIKRIKRDYSIAACVTGVAFAGICVAFSTFSMLGIALVCYCAACLALYLACNMAVKNLVMTEDWENFQKDINMNYIPVGSKKGAISPWWYVFYIPIIAFVCYVSYGTNITYGYVLPAIQVVFGAVMLVVHIMIKNSNQYAHKRNVERSIEENQKFRRSWSTLAFFAGLVTELMLSFLQLGLLEIVKNDVIISASPFVVTILVTAAAIAVAFRNNNSK